MKSSPQVKRRTAFTLIELLVVMAIIAILIALLLPAIQQAREAARRVQCKNNLHQIGLAMHNYENAHRTFPPGWVWPNSHGWATMLLPYLEQQNLYSTANFNATITSAFGGATKLAGFRCPSDATSPDFGDSGSPVVALAVSAYPGSFGSGTLGTNACNGLYYSNSGNSIRSITDGTSNTFAVGERDHSKQGLTFWPGTGADNAADVVGTTQVAFGSGMGGFGSQHANGGHMMMCDGSVSFLSYSMDANTFQNMSTISGGEIDGGPPVASVCGGSPRSGPCAAPSPGSLTNTGTLLAGNVGYFNALFSQMPPATIVSLSFDWGDGSPLQTTGYPIFTVGHTTAAAGNLNVTVTATNSCGLTASTSRTFVVH